MSRQYSSGTVASRDQPGAKHLRTLWQRLGVITRRARLYHVHLRCRASHMGNRCHENNGPAPGGNFPIRRWMLLFNGIYLTVMSSPSFIIGITLCRAASRRECGSRSGAESVISFAIRPRLVGIASLSSSMRLINLSGITLASAAAARKHILSRAVRKVTRWLVLTLKL